MKPHRVEGGSLSCAYCNRTFTFNMMRDKGPFVCSCGPSTEARERESSQPPQPSLPFDSDPDPSLSSPDLRGVEHCPRGFTRYILKDPELRYFQLTMDVNFSFAPDADGQLPAIHHTRVGGVPLKRYTAITRDALDYHWQEK